ncbi:MAG: hypothetical protein IT578_03440 [Verrucomicrobiae bacterium]|nr:hypothetical protein [Verrucomicrobiae bacterium]
MFTRFVFLVCFLTAGTWAWAQQPVVQIKKIETTLEAAPRYQASVQIQKPQPDSNRKWLMVEAELETLPDWCEELQVRFYVVANYGSQARERSPDGFDILSANVAVVNVPKGRKNVVPVFMDANTVRKYGAISKDQFVPQVAVMVYYRGVLQDTQWMTNARKGERFWEQKQPIGGVLLNLLQSPWWPAFSEYYEQVKPMGGGVAAP